MVNFAIIGTGIMADIYATIIGQRLDVDLKFVVGNTSDKTLAFVKKHRVDKYTVLGELKPLFECECVDAIIIASPEWSRVDELEQLLLNERHVLIEKPFMTDFEKSSNILPRLKKMKRVIEYCTVLRFSPKFDAAKRAISRGEIGKIRHVLARRDSNKERVKRVLNKTDLAYWLAPHDLDMLYYLTDSKIDSITSLTHNNACTDDDYIIATIKFENGVSAVLQNSWCSPRVSNLTMNAVFEIYGTEGKIEIIDSDMDVKVFNPNRTFQPDTYEFSMAQNNNYGIFYNTLDSFIKRVIERDVKKNPQVIDIIETNMKMCDLLSKSLRSN